MITTGDVLALYQRGEIGLDAALRMMDSILTGKLISLLPWPDPWKTWDPAEVLGSSPWFSAPLSRLCAPEGFTVCGAFGQPLGGGTDV